MTEPSPRAIPKPSENWYSFDGGKSIGKPGSESGTVIRDEEHGDGARITLERDATYAPFAITCGIYGWMLHTRFFETEAEAQSEFDAMKAELSKVVATIPLASDSGGGSELPAVTELLSQFVHRFP